MSTGAMGTWARHYNDGSTNSRHVKEGHIGFVLKTDSSASVEVKWLTILNTREPASDLVGFPSSGPCECLDLLTSPVPQL